MGWKKNESITSPYISFKECFTVLLRNYKENYDFYFNTYNYDEIEAEINYLINDDDMYKPSFTSVEIVDKDGLKIPYSKEERLHHIKSAIKNMNDDASFFMSDNIKMPKKYLYYTFSYTKFFTIGCLLLILLMKNSNLKLFFLTLLFFMYFFL